MIRTHFILLSLTVPCAFSACKKDDADPPPEIPPTPLSISSFSRLDSGNYWVYEERHVDSLDVPLSTVVNLDSLYVTGDTVLDGVEYAVIRKAWNGQVSTMTQYW